MTRPVVLTVEAQAELDEAIDRYQERAGSGVKFVARVGRVLDGIGRLPEAHAVVHSDIRRSVVSRTPYSVYYRVREDRIEVISIFHGRRDPSSWKGRA